MCTSIQLYIVFNGLRLPMYTIICLQHCTHKAMYNLCIQESALHFASSYGRVEAVKRIIDAGTNVNAVDMVS